LNRLQSRIIILGIILDSIDKVVTMADQIPPKSEPLLKNPQVVATIIGGIITLLVAIVGVLPNLLNKGAATPQPTILLVIATQIPPTATPIPIAATATDEIVQAPVTSAAPTAVVVPPTALFEPTPTPPLLPTPAPNVLLLYDEVSFTLLNEGQGTLSLEGVVFHSDSGAWDARKWGASIYNSLPAGKCLRLRDASVGNRQPPASCGSPIYGLQVVGASVLFWVGVGKFDVVRNGTVIATCTVADQSCAVAIP
jgi:hypothetical protein